jgi:hypothetical protein
MRKLLALVALLCAWAIGIALLRRSGSKRDRIDLYFEDGSMQSVAEGAPESARLLPLARAALSAARGA